VQIVIDASVTLPWSIPGLGRAERRDPAEKRAARAHAMR
jgi:hypothetical protein